MKLLTRIFLCMMLGLSSQAFAGEGVSEISEARSDKETDVPRPTASQEEAYEAAQASFLFQNYLQASLIFQNYLNNKGDSSELTSLYVMFENGLPGPNRMTFYTLDSTADEVFMTDSESPRRRIKNSELSEFISSTASSLTAEQIQHRLSLVFNAELVVKKLTTDAMADPVLTNPLLAPDRVVKELTADAIADAMFGSFGSRQSGQNIVNYATVIAGEYGAFVATLENPYFFLPNGAIVRLADLGAKDLFGDVSEWMERFR